MERLELAAQCQLVAFEPGVLAGLAKQRNQQGNDLQSNQNQCQRHALLKACVAPALKLLKTNQIAPTTRP